jgi:hypothetical protein
MIVARALVEDIIVKFVISQSILTDQGSNFMSEVFGNVCKLLKIKSIIEPTGVGPDEKQLRAVRDFPEPRTNRELEGLVGLTGYYRRFIPILVK